LIYSLWVNHPFLFCSPPEPFESGFGVALGSEWLWGQPLTKDIFISISETFFLNAASLFYVIVLRITDKPWPQPKSYILPLSCTANILKEWSSRALAQLS
jgi:hypothetical protein